VPTTAQPAPAHGLLAKALSEDWYHTMELAPGAVTRGWIDLRPVAGKLVGDLSGLRALDVGTFDGFWAFTMERAGARQVVATDLPSVEDIQIPPPHRPRVLAQLGGLRLGRRFSLAAELLGSAVRRVESSIHDLDAERLGGPFDFVLVSDVLLHVRDPVGGLEAVHRVLEPGGRLLLAEQINLLLAVLHPRLPVAKMDAPGTPFNWWEANPRCLRDWLLLAGFTRPHRRRWFRVSPVGHRGLWHVALEARREQGRWRRTPPPPGSTAWPSPRRSPSAGSTRT
jgi:SAM-dependent methyltransferase